MELNRQDFPRYLAQMRHTIAPLKSAVGDAYFANEAECLIRIARMMEAEAGYLQETLGAQLAETAELIATIDQILGSGTHEEADSLDQRITLERRWVKIQSALALLSVAQDDRAPVLLDHILAAQISRIDAVNARRRQLEVDDAKLAVASPGASADNGGALTAEAVEAYLRAQFPTDAGLRVSAIRTIPGGRSKQTVLIETVGSDALPSRLIMRADIEGGLVPSKATDEFDLLRVVERHQDIPTPRTILSECDKSKLGSSFILVEAVPGTTKGDYFPEVNGQVPGDAKLGRQLAGILARLHQIDPSEFSHTHLDASLDAVASARATIEATYQQALQTDQPTRVIIEAAYRWLIANLHLAEDKKVLIHCDVGLHNLLVDEGQITALLDWELATFAAPARELAKILHLIDYLMPRQDFFDAYLAAGGPVAACDPDRLSFYAVLNYMVTCQRTRQGNRMFFDGGSSIVRANSGYDFFYRTSGLLADALRQARARN